MHSNTSLYKKLLVSAILILIFSVSLPFRIPYIYEQTDCNDECHLNMITIMKVWQHDGAFNHKLSPCITFWNSGDKFAAYFKRLEDRKGDNYYASYPSLIYIITYPLVCIAGLSHAKVVMQCMNLVFHFLSCIFIYLIVIRYFRIKFEKLFLPALVAFAVYVFAPVILSLHTHIYFPEMLGQVMFVVVLFFTQKVIDKDTKLKTSGLWVFGILIFLLVFSEWIGVFYVFVLCLFLYFNKTIRADKRTWLTILVSTATALLVTFIQYASISGFKPLAVSYFMRFAERSGYFAKGYFSEGGNIFNPETYYAYMINFLHGAGWFGLFAVVLLAIWLIRMKGFNGFRRLSQNIIAVMAVTPVIISMLIFFNSHAYHFHYMAKLIVPVALGTGIVCQRLHFNAMNSHRIMLSLLVALVCIISVFSLIHYRHLEELEIALTDQNEMHKAAAYVTRVAAADEVIFLTYASRSSRPMIYLNLLCERNMVEAQSLFDARCRFAPYPQRKAAYIQISDSLNTYNVEHYVK
jgi:hypothetical protein